MLAAVLGVVIVLESAKFEGASSTWWPEAVLTM